MNPEELFECISQALINAFDRDATSGWGAVVHLVYVEENKKKALKIVNCFNFDFYLGPLTL